MDHLELNKQLQKKAFKILSNQSLWGDRREEMQNDFIDKYYEVLRICLDTSVSKKSLQAIIEGGKKESYVDLMKYASRVVENDRSYILLNYFLVNYLNTISEVTSDNVLPINNIMFTQITSEYNKIFKSND